MYEVKVRPKPLGHLVAIRVDSIDEVSKGGIVLSGMLDQKERARHEDGRQSGVVEELGPAAYKEFGDGSPWVKPGDHVFFKRFAGLEVRDTQGVLFRILNDDDIYGVFPEEEIK